MTLRRLALLLTFCMAAASAADGQPRPPKMEEGCIRAEPSGLGRILAASPPGPIALGDGPLSVRLVPVCGEGPGLLERLRARLRVLLVIDDLRARVQPGVLYDLRLGDAGAGTRGRRVLVGTLNFFAAQHPGVAARPRRVSYDVTGPLRALVERGGWSGDLALAIEPQRPPEPGAGAGVGRVALAEP